MIPSLNVKNYPLLKKPTLGLLLDLSEENYHALIRCIPQLKQLKGSFDIQGQPPFCLHLDVLEQTPYTSLIRLSHYFNNDQHPEILMRVYHDAHQIKIIELKQQNRQKNILLDRWQRHLFLSKWLNYCIEKGYFLFNS